MKARAGRERVESGVMGSRENRRGKAVHQPKGGKPAGGIGSGVDADAMAGAIDTIRDDMAMDQRQPLGRRAACAAPNQSAQRLGCKRGCGICTRMGQKIGTDLDCGGQVAQELQVMFGQMG